MNILLKEVTTDNWYDCVCLKVAENQKGFVAPNSFSLAQAAYMPDCKPLCIYDDETMVGFAMIAIDKEVQGKAEDQLWICRLMIDEKFQGKGLGKASLAKILDYIKENYNYNKIYISEASENYGAKELYKKFGFEFTGEVEDGEEVMILKLS